MITQLECPNDHTVEQILRPLSEVTFEAGHCPTCGVLRESTLTHLISGEENFLHRTLASVGVPPLHIVKAHNGLQYRFYELTGDLPDTLHFHDFEKAHINLAPCYQVPSHKRVRLKDEIKLKGTAANSGAEARQAARLRPYTGWLLRTADDEHL